MSAKHQWAFQARFRAKAYGWRGTSLASKRLKEAVSEIKEVAKTDPVTAADGAVTLFERFWPALEFIDSSSGALGRAVDWTQEELIPVVRAAPADRSTRDKWLARLWQAIQEDGVDYLSVTAHHWGELCVWPELASQWADQFVDLVRAAWTDPKRGRSVRGTSLCLSSLLRAGRHEEIWDLLAVARFPFWPYRKFGVEALLKEGRVDEALEYAEASRHRNQPRPAIDETCERILLMAGRADEAYLRYAIVASQRATGVATFRALTKKYPHIEPRKILIDLVQASGEPGLYFAAAKDCGFYDLALDFAREGHTNPLTLSRASRDIVGKNPEFAMEVGHLALERLLLGLGYEVTAPDVVDAFRHFLAAAGQCGMRESALREATALANVGRSKKKTKAFGEEILRSVQAETRV